MRHLAFQRAKGFKVLDLMIVFATTTLILNLGWPSLSDFAVRTKHTEALTTAYAAKQAVATTCMENSSITGLDNHKAGFEPEPSPYVRTVNIAGDCKHPVITVIAHVTGKVPETEFRISGKQDGRSSNFLWECVGDAPAEHLPEECRGAASML
jgi:Tfp pilus assembly protein PilE